MAALGGHDMGNKDTAVWEKADSETYLPGMSHSGGAPVPADHTPHRTARPCPSPNANSDAWRHLGLDKVNTF